MGSDDDEHSLVFKVKRWLDEQGYPLEMRVASAFQASGFRVFNSEYYKDLESGMYREIDVVASTQKLISGCLVRLSLCLECKISRNKPWLLFSSTHTRLADPARIAQRAASKLGLEFLRSVAHDVRFHKLDLFSLPTRPGFGLTQAFVTGNDIAYQACMSAAKAAASEASRAEWLYNSRESILEISLPVVVIEGQLFECFLDDGEIRVEEIEIGHLVWRNPIMRRPHTIVIVARSSYLDQLVDQASKAATLIFQCENEINKILNLKGSDPREIEASAGPDAKGSGEDPGHIME